MTVKWCKQVGQTVQRIREWNKNKEVVKNRNKEE